MSYTILLNKKRQLKQVQQTLKKMKKLFLIKFCIKNVCQKQIIIINYK